MGALKRRACKERERTKAIILALVSDARFRELVLDWSTMKRSRVSSSSQEAATFVPFVIDVLSMCIDG